ncbi:MAG: hypothetical protein C1O27_001763 [Chloroflexi bacterium]|nr:MAG: hypothetical protein C1O27_001763 [Chloroflexota bacterium]
MFIRRISYGKEAIRHVVTPFDLRTPLLGVLGKLQHDTSLLFCWIHDPFAHIGKPFNYWTVRMQQNQSLNVSSSNDISRIYGTPDEPTGPNPSGQVNLGSEPIKFATTFSKIDASGLQPRKLRSLLDSHLMDISTKRRVFKSSLGINKVYVTRNSIPDHLKTLNFFGGSH